MAETSNAPLLSIQKIDLIMIELFEGTNQIIAILSVSRSILRNQRNQKATNNPEFNPFFIEKHNQ